MGEEKLDNTVYTVRGPVGPGRPGAAKGDAATERWAAGRGAT